MPGNQVLNILLGVWSLLFSRSSYSSKSSEKMPCCHVGCSFQFHLYLLSVLLLGL